MCTSQVVLPSIFSFDVPEMKDGSTSSVVDHNNCKCFGDIPNLCLHFGTVIRVSCFCQDCQSSSDGEMSVICAVLG